LTAQRNRWISYPDTAVLGHWLVPAKSEYQVPLVEPGGVQLHPEELLGLDAHGTRHCHTLVV